MEQAKSAFKAVQATITEGINVLTGNDKKSDGNEENSSTTTDKSRLSEKNFQQKDIEPRQIDISSVSELENVEEVKKIFNRHLHLTVVKDRITASNRDYYTSIAYTVRDHLIAQWIHTNQHHFQTDEKRVYYLSQEYHTGRALSNSLINLSIETSIDEALYQMGLNMEELEELEIDPALGNGGLGRLAACYLDSMSTLGISGFGYSLRYDYGTFAQKLQDGFQVECPDDWLKYGNPWEISRPEYIVPVHFYGQIADDGNGKKKWINTEIVEAIPYDTPIPGYNNNIVNTLRLWAAVSRGRFDMKLFNTGDYTRAVADENEISHITRILYPNENFDAGKLLRLKQEYFLVSASLQDIIRRFKNSKPFSVEEKKKVDFTSFPDKAAIQLNDTHPSLTIAELMRLLIDEENLSWNEAFDITKKVVAYTNHTLLSEAIERWQIDMLKELLPRHFEIIQDINEHHLNFVKGKWPDDKERMKRMSIVDHKKK